MDWKKDYEHGLIWQDFQHEKFIDNMNILLGLVLAKEQDEQSFNRVANFSIQYCNNHFKTEERYMIKHGYPRTENHIKQHNQFIKDLKKLISQKNFDDTKKTAELLNGLMAWFAKHILETDKHLANFIITHDLF